MPGFLILAALVGSAVFVLSIPVDLAVYFATDGRPKLRVEVHWWFGLVRRELRRRKRRGRGEAGDRRALERVKKKAGLVLRLVRTEGLIPQFVRLLRDIFRHARVHDLSVVCRVGLGDPADTGFLFALIGPTVLLLRRSLPYEMRVDPVFLGDAIFQVNSRVMVRVRPVALVPALAQFTFSRAAARALWRMIPHRWKRRET